MNFAVDSFPARFRSAPLHPCLYYPCDPWLTHLDLGPALRLGLARLFAYLVFEAIGKRLP